MIATTKWIFHPTPHPKHQPHFTFVSLVALEPTVVSKVCHPQCHSLYSTCLFDEEKLSLGGGESIGSGVGAIEHSRVPSQPHHNAADAGLAVWWPCGAKARHSRALPPRTHPTHPHTNRIGGMTWPIVCVRVCAGRKGGMGHRVVEAIRRIEKRWCRTGYDRSFN